MPLLQLKNVEKHFGQKAFLGETKIVRAVDGVSLDLYKGETLGIVGESGCGKSTLASLMIRLEEVTGGHIYLDDLELSGLPEKKLRAIRSRIQIVFQDPYSSLDPRFTVGEIIAEPMKVLGKWSKEEMNAKTLSLLQLVGLSQEHLSRYPHEFSGGQRQRISIARALTTDPDILILDEPTSALDVSVQAQVLNLLIKLQKNLGLTYVFISHNLSVIKYVSNRVAVMYFGKIVEIGETEKVMLHPRHPYTRELIAAVPAIGKALSGNALAQEEKIGEESAAGCRYVSRCAMATPACRESVPQLAEYETGHKVACWEMHNIE